MGPQGNANARLNNTLHKMDNQDIFEASTERCMEPNNETLSLEGVLSVFAGM